MYLSISSVAPHKVVIFFVFLPTQAEHSPEGRGMSHLVSEGYGTNGLCIFIREGILDGCKERLFVFVISCAFGV